MFRFGLDAPLQQRFLTPFWDMQQVTRQYLLFYFAVCFVAKKLCSMWDEHKENKAVKKTASAPKPQPVIPNVDQVRFCRKCGEKHIDNSHFCRKCGRKLSSENNTQCEFCGTVVEYHTEVVAPTQEIDKEARKQTEVKPKKKKPKSCSLLFI